MEDRNGLLFPALNGRKADGILHELCVNEGLSL
jgi:hypothetical protein